MLSAWCLGILNSHRKFFLSYAAPVIWNAGDDRDDARCSAPHGPVRRWRSTLAWGSVAGSALQFGGAAAVRCCGWCRELRLALDTASANVRDRDPQLRARCSSAAAWCRSAPTWISCSRACWATGAVAGADQRADDLHAAGEPVRHGGLGGRTAGDVERAGDRSEIAVLRQRLNAGLRQIAFFIVPSAMAFLALGDVITAALFENGEFTLPTRRTSGGFSPVRRSGLLASTLGRLYSSDLLCAARYAHAAALRDPAGGPDDGVWAALPRRFRSSGAWPG